MEEACAPLASFWPEGHHLGMGLYTVRQVAEMHGGELTYSREGGFRMTLRRMNQLAELM
jgi:signal transduction histidine kinase